MEHETPSTESLPSTEIRDESHIEAQGAPGTHSHYLPARDIRRARRKEKRHLNQVERTRVREHLHAGLLDPEAFDAVEDRKPISRKLHKDGNGERGVLLFIQKRRLKSELGNTRDLDTFIHKTSRSRTLYALIGLGFFRHVLRSETFRDDHRYKLAILRAMEEPGLGKSIQRRWEAFDREFPDPALREAW